MSLQLTRQAKLAHHSDKVWGCRHMCQGVLKCTHYVDRRAKYLADKFEPVVQEVSVGPMEQHLGVFNV